MGTGSREALLSVQQGRSFGLLAGCLALGAPYPGRDVGFPRPASFLRCPLGQICRETNWRRNEYARLACGGGSPLLLKREAPATHNPVAGALLPPLPIDIFLALESVIDVEDAAIVVHSELHQLKYRLGLGGCRPVLARHNADASVQLPDNAGVPF